MKNEEYWKNHKADWVKSYWDTRDHPHRALILEKLKKIRCGSLCEIGCNCGPNLSRIKEAFPAIQIGGMDINPTAIETAKKLLPNGNFDVSNAEDIFLSDRSVDVVLTDACLIYVRPHKIKEVIKEIRRVVRNNVLFVEFHSKNPLIRLLLRLKGYYAYNYEKLLDKYDFWDIKIEKIPKGSWPDSKGWERFGYIISAKK